MGAGARLSSTTATATVTATTAAANRHHRRPPPAATAAATAGRRLVDRARRREEFERVSGLLRSRRAGWLATRGCLPRSRLHTKKEKQNKERNTVGDCGGYAGAAGHPHSSSYDDGI